MAKRKVNTPVVFDKRQFLMPKMVKYNYPDGTWSGLYFKEIGGVELLSFKELAEEMEKAGEILPAQAFDMMAKFIVLSACDERGHCIFTEEDSELIRAKNPNLIMDMANTAMPLSGLQFTGVDIEVTSNLKNAQPVSSTINSPTN